MIDTAILLNAGQGSRLLPLTADRPKCLIEVGGKTIVDHQLDALAAVGVERRIVVGGYKIDKLAAHLGARGDAVELLFNPFWAVSSSISSVWAARDLLAGDFAIMNGDTVYDPEILRRGFEKLQPGLNLFVEPIRAAAHDDMLVETDGVRIRAVAKTLDPSSARFRSLGVVVGCGESGVYRDTLEAVIRAENGVQSFHHGVVDKIARGDGVNAVVIDHGRWVEIDRPEDIAGWRPGQ